MLAVLGRFMTCMMGGATDSDAFYHKRGQSKSAREKTMAER